MRAALPLSVLLLLLMTPVAVAARTSPLDDTSLPGINRYERCLALSKENARSAVHAALAWHDEGGGAAALHCEALALVALRRYSEAAVILDDAALAAPRGDTNLRVALFDQAGNAWLLANEPQKAESSINSALTLAPRDEDIRFDRARARAALKNWPGAEADLSALLALDADRADAFVLRASARHAEGRKNEADADIAHALQIYPNYPEALVERGAMKYEAGDTNGARADWELVIRDSPNSDAGAAAREHLDDMTAAKPDVK
jgi:tetratricopeptide (TPR) repeat protein